MNRASRNPFEYGRELGRAELVDRDDEMATLRATVRNRGKLFLIGPRRFGKTSLLSALDEEMSRAGVVVLRHDAEKFEALELLAGAILASATKRLEGGLEKAIAAVSKAAGRLRPEFVIEGDSVAVRLGVDRTAEALPLLAEALDAVERLARQTGQEVCLILDEVQQIVTEHGIAAERQLRSTVQKHRHVSYIFSGSATRMLSEMTSDPNRPFYRLGQRLFLGTVPRAEFTTFLHDAFGTTGLQLTEPAAEHILERAGEVPYNVQRLAHETWELARTRGRKRIDPALIDEALRRIVLREDPAYTQIWTSLTANQRKAMKAVVTAGGRQLLSAEVAHARRISTSSLQVALKALEAGHLVRVEARLGASEYRLVDPFFAEWLAASQQAG
jgi:uncharacterized protein